MDKLDWNDLRYVVAISRSGSAAAAARLLGVSHTTVLRRIQTLERGIGTPLFYRRSIHVEMIATNDRLDLDRRDADVVLRPTGRPPESWVGTRLAGLGFGLYVAKAYLNGRHGPDWTAFDWVVPGGLLSQRPIADWLNVRIPVERRVMTVDSLVAMRELVLEGAGATLLPHFMGRDDRLQLLESLPPEVSGESWLLTHVNLRHTRRINVFIEHVAQAARAALQDGPGTQRSAAPT